MGGQVTFAEELKFFSDAWREKAQRDDLFNEMVPSDFRIAIQYITEASETISSLEAENARLREALEYLVEEKVDYMNINKLGDPEKQHSVKLARAALSTIKEKEK